MLDFQVSMKTVFKVLMMIVIQIGNDKEMVIQVEEHRTQLPSPSQLWREDRSPSSSLALSSAWSSSSSSSSSWILSGNASMQHIIWASKRQRLPRALVQKRLGHSDIQLRLSDWRPGQPRTLVRTRSIRRASLLQSRGVPGCVGDLKPYQGGRRDLHLQVWTISHLYRCFSITALFTISATESNARHLKKLKTQGTQYTLLELFHA